MATATAKQTESRTIEAPRTVGDFIRAQGADADPKMLLELAVAETERVRAVASQQLNASKAFADVTVGADGLFHAANMAGLMEMATVLAFSGFVPEKFRGNKYNCFVACSLAQNWKLQPIMVMGELFLVHDQPGISAKLAVAVALNSGVLDGVIETELSGEGDSRQCVAKAKIKATGQIITYKIDMALAKREGWLRNEKWKTMPDDMLDYRTQAWLIRHRIPHVLMGIPLVDELEEIGNGTPTAKAIQAENAKPATNRLSTVTDKLKNGNGKTNGHHSKPEPTPESVDTAESQEAGPTQEEVTHAENNGGELPSDEGAPTPEEMATNARKELLAAIDKEMDAVHGSTIPLSDIDKRVRGGSDAEVLGSEGFAELPKLLSKHRKRIAEENNPKSAKQAAAK